MRGKVEGKGVKRLVQANDMVEHIGFEPMTLTLPV